MPIIKQFQDGNAKIVVWKITETVEEFSSLIDSSLIDPEIQHPKRRRQWFASRCAVAELVGYDTLIAKDRYGKPHADNGSCISLSHTETYAVAAMSSKPIGIDVEEITPRINRIASRFIHPEEAKLIPVSDPDKLIAQYIIWCGKEAAYKLYGKKAVDFKEEIRVAFDGTSNDLSIQKLKDYPTPIYGSSMMIDNHLIAWVAV